MSNTTIQIKFSTEAGNTPSSLANGEIAINTADGTLYYAQPDGTITAFSGFSGPSGLDTEIQFNDGGILGANSKLTFDKTTGILTVNGTVVANAFTDDGVDIYVHAERAYAHANAAYAAANAGSGVTSISISTGNGLDTYGSPITSSGTITITANVASTAQVGVVQLYDGVGANSTTFAATANSVYTVNNKIAIIEQHILIFPAGGDWGYINDFVYDGVGQDERDGIVFDCRTTPDYRIREVDLGHLS